MFPSLKKFLKIILIFLLVFAWVFSGWPQIWQNPPIPPEIQGGDLFIALLLTDVLAFAILIIVNPPRAVFGPCGVFIFGKNL